MQCQYIRKARDVQPPVAATISGGTPASSSSTAPPIQKLCPKTWARCADFHIDATKVRKSCFSMFLMPERDWYVNKEEDGGTLKLTLRWFFNAAHGQRVSLRAVRVTRAPSCLVVLVHGIRKCTEQVPSRSSRNEILSGNV